MPALRRLARPAVATTAAVLLLSGCGDDDGDGGGGDDLAAFCDQALSFEALPSELSAVSPDEYGPILQQAVDDLGTVEPPAEIADEWQTVTDALRRFADAFSGVDPTTPEGQAAVQRAAQDFSTDAESAGTTIESYLADNCTDA